jgi:putative membrane protein
MGMKAAKLLILATGFLLLLLLLARLNPAAVLAALAHLGWLAFGTVLVSGLGLTACLAAGLFPLLSGQAPAVRVFAARQVRDSAGDILPFTQITGIALGMRALVLGGVAPAIAVAAGIVDVTAELMAQSLFILLGIALAAPAIRADPHLGPYLGWLVAGTIVFAGGILAFAFLQLAGSRFAEMVLGRISIGANAAAFRDAIHALYRQRSRVVLSVGLHLIGWCASGLWLWVVFWALGKPVTPAAAIAIQSLLEALRSALVFVPSAIGIQEAGYAALVPLFGLGPETGIAASLVRRARDIAIGIPVLLLWQLSEAHRIRQQAKTPL